MQLPPEDARDMSTFNKVPYWLVVEYILVKDGLSDAAVASGMLLSKLSEKCVHLIHECPTFSILAFFNT